MRKIHKDGDTDWLIGQIPERDALNFKGTRLATLLDLIRNADMDSLPRTIGVFGSWGSGKTTLLAMLAKELFETNRNNSYFPVIYFNAWKYAGFMEVVPALVYKILKFVAPADDPSALNAVSKIMLSIGKKYVDQFGDWTRNRFGINVSELSQDILQAKKEWTEEQERGVLLEEYYTQVDKAQDTLAEVFKGLVNPAVVIVDELDRCDPGEAFEVIKKMRVFFSMRGIPIIFVLSVNPDPIGAAIRHQYGLSSDTSDYEARRILEKFVDTYIDMNDPVPLEALIRQLWERPAARKGMGLVHQLDMDFDRGRYVRDTVRNADIFLAMETDNYLYGNIRILKKSMDYVLAKGTDDKSLLWTKWHLEIIRQAHLAVRKKVAKIAKDIAQISAKSHLAMLKTLSDSGKLDWDTHRILEPNLLVTSKGNTAFSIYRSWFWDNAKQHLEEKSHDGTSEGLAGTAILKEFLSDYHLMDFLAIMSLVDFPKDDRMRKIYSGTEDFGKVSFHAIPGMSHFSWSLANY